MQNRVYRAKTHQRWQRKRGEFIRKIFKNSFYPGAAFYFIVDLVFASILWLPKIEKRLGDLSLGNPYMSARRQKYFRMYS